MRALPALAIVAAAALLAGCAAPAPPGPPGDADVTMENVRFVPADVTARAGEEVVWANGGQLMHTVTSVDGRFDSGNLFPGGVFRFAFREPGTYEYYCRPHAGQGPDGRWQGMVGTLTVAA